MSEADELLIARKWLAQRAAVLREAAAIAESTPMLEPGATAIRVYAKRLRKAAETLERPLELTPETSLGRQ
jgi:hypothetical protein